MFVAILMHYDFMVGRILTQNVLIKQFLPEGDLVSLSFIKDPFLPLDLNFAVNRPVHIPFESTGLADLKLVLWKTVVAITSAMQISKFLFVVNLVSYKDNVSLNTYFFF